MLNNIRNKVNNKLVSIDAALNSLKKTKAELEIRIKCLEEERHDMCDVLGAFPPEEIGGK